MKPSFEHINRQLPKFDYYSQRAIPLVYDESLSYMELLAKMAHHLNETGQLTNDMVGKWNEVNEWVVNDGVSESVGHRLDEMTDDGTLDKIINVNIFKDLNKDIDKNTDDITDIGKTLTKVHTKISSVFDAKEFGVKGDGTDESLALQKAITEAVGTLTFSAGTYVFSKPLVRTKSNLQIVCSPDAKFYFKGAFAEKAISFVGSEGGATTLLANVVAGIDSIQVSSIPDDWNDGDWIEINSDETWGPRVDYYKIEYVRIKSIDRGTRTVTLQTGTNFSYDRSRLHAIKKQNFLTNIGIDGFDLTCTEDISRWGISFERCYQPKAYNNKIYYAQYFGIDVRYCVYPMIESNHVVITTNRDALNYAICFTTVGNGLIRNNALTSARTAIDISKSSAFCNIEGNTVYLGNINSHNSLKSVINGNTLQGGMLLIRGPYHNITGNVIRFRNTALYQGAIVLDEAANIGHINIVGNTIEGSADFPLSYGIYSTLIDIANVNITGNDIFNVSVGVGFIMPDNTSTTRNINVGNNTINIKSKTGITSVGVHLQRVSNANIHGNIITGEGDASSKGVYFWASGGAFKNIIINSNEIFKVGDIVNVSNYHANIMCMGNVADDCSGGFTSGATVRKFKDNIRNGTHDVDSIV